MGSEDKADAGEQSPEALRKERIISFGGPGIFLFVLAIFFIVCAAKGSDAGMLFVGVIVTFVVVGELLYSRFLAKYIFDLKDSEVTPANEPGHENDPDFCSTPTYILWGHHWTSITGAAPIVGPGIAAYYGWLPGVAWVVLGCLFSGAVHDFSVLVVSARNGGRSIADLAGYIVSWRMRILFLVLILFLCMLVVAKFMEVIAKLFILWPATVLPVWMEVPLSVGLGFAGKFLTGRMGAEKARLPILALSVVVFFLLYVFVFVGSQIETEADDPPVFGWKFTKDGMCRDSVNYKRDKNGNATEPKCGFGAMQIWTIILVIYAMVASVLPVWVLLQPRDYVNSHQLKAVLACLLIGLAVEAPKIDAPAVRKDIPDSVDNVFPGMFTLIACGATSGFHGLVSSGVTSKQVSKMTATRVIGYSSMLGESALSALVIIAVCSTGKWAKDYASYGKWTPFLGAGADLLKWLPGAGSVERMTIMNVLVVSFAATTLDSGLRIERILVGELGKCMEKVPPLKPVARVFGNIFFQVIISALPPICIANSRSIGAVWNLFGATNQLTACVSLVVVAVYVLRFRNFDWKYVIPFAVPITWLLVVITWALIDVIRKYFETCLDKITCDWDTTTPTIPTIGLALIIGVFVLLMYVEIVFYFVTKKYKVDSGIDEEGKMEQCKLCSGSDVHMPNMGCC